MEKSFGVAAESYVLHFWGIVAVLGLQCLAALLLAKALSLSFIKIHQKRARWRDASKATTTRKPGCARRPPFVGDAALPLADVG